MLKLKKIHWNFDKVYFYMYLILIISSILGYTISVPGSSNIYLFHVVLMAMIVLLAYGIIKRKVSIKLTHKVKVIILFYIIWVIYSIISGLWAKDVQLYLKFTSILVMMVVFMFTLIIVNNTNSMLKTTVNIIKIMFLISLFIGLLESLTSFRLPISPFYNLAPSVKYAEEVAHMPTVFFYNTNNFATYITMFLPLYFSEFIWAADKNEKIKCGVIIGLSLITIIFSSSRFNMIAFFIMFIVSIMYKKVINKFEKIDKIILISISIFILLVIILGHILPLPKDIKDNIDFIEITKEAITSLFAKKTSLASIGVRAAIFKITLANIFSGHIFGAGSGNIRYLIKLKHLTGKISDPHNWWLEILGDYGIFIFAFYVYIIILVIKTAIKLAKMYSETKLEHLKELSVLIGFTIISLSGFIVGCNSPSSITYFIPHWLYMGLVITIINRAEISA